MGEVVDWSCPAAVEFDDHAQMMVARMAAVLAGTASIMLQTEMPDLRRRGVQVVDELAPHADMILEHIDVLEKHANVILGALTDDEEGYFSNTDKLQIFTVMSLAKRKCRTLRVQRFFINKRGCKAVQDNDKIALECHDGLLACGMHARPPKRRASRLKKLRA